MLRARTGIYCAMIAAAGGASGAAQATVYVYDKDNVKFFASGIAELDAISDTTRGLAETLGSSPAAKKGTVAGNNGEAKFSVRNSRLGFGLLTSRPGEVKGKGYIELDLLGYEPAVGSGTPAESEAGYYQNAAMRVRHAYLTAEGAGWSVLAGQYWSLFGWQNDFVPSTVSVAPITGTAYERTPQLTFTKSFGDADSTMVQAGVSASRPTQRESATPNVDAGVRLKLGGRLAPYAATNGEVKPTGTTLGVSGTFRQLAHLQASAIDKESHAQASAVAVDAMIPLLAIAKGEAVGNTLVLTGEFTKGSGYGDQFPSWSGNVAAPAGAAGSLNAVATQPNVDAGVVGYDKAGVFTPIKLTTWNASLQYHFPHGWDTWATGGFAELSSDNAAVLGAAKDKLIYDRVQDAYGNVIHNFNQEIRAGLEYDWHHTGYADNTHGQNNRVQVSTWYRF